MKVAIFVTYTFPYIGSGIGNVALKQAEMLAGLGYDVTMVSSNFPKTDKEFIKKKVKHLKLPAIYLLEKIHVPVPLYLFNYQVIKLIKSSDIIHIHDSVYPSSFLAAIIGKLFNKPIILTQHVAFITYRRAIVNLIQKFAYLTLGKLSFSLSDRIIIYNPKVKKFVNKDKKSCLMSNGVDFSLFCPVRADDKILFRKKYSLPLDKKIILFVGRLVPKKGFHLLFEARDKRYLLLFIGSGKIPEYMRKAKNVLFFPARKQEELSEIYKLSDIFLLPSYGEGFPLSIQEAMASGLPVITSKYNIFGQSLNFIKTVDLNAQTIKNSIVELLGNDKLMTKMGMLSRQFALKNYSWEENLKKLIKIYQEELQ